MLDPRHHQRIRKQSASDVLHLLENKRIKLFIDRLVYLVGFAVPIMTLPQLSAIFVYHDTSSLSVATWGTYFVGTCFWFLYGIVHKERPIIVFNLVTALIQGSIVVGIFWYR